MQNSKSTSLPKAGASSTSASSKRKRDNPSRASASGSTQLSKSVINHQPLSSKKAANGGSASAKPKSSKKVGLLSDVDIVASHTGNSSNKQQIFGGSLYSKALLRGNDDTSVGVQLASLRYLEGANRLFFRKCSTFPPELKSFNPRNKRGIWNASGRVLYYTGQKKIYVCKGCYYSGFIHEVVDYSGKTVIISTGRQLVFGLSSRVEISLEGGKLLGTMHQSCLSSTYEIKDSSGRLVYKIQAPCFAPCAPFVFWCCREHFELCMDDGVTEIGKITNSWGNSVTVSEFRNCLGIEMDRVDDIRVKALLLGCFFLIEFQYYKGGGNGIFYFLLLVLLFVGCVVYFECFGFCHIWNENKPTPIDKVL